MESAIVYDDLDLLFERANGSYQIRVIESPSGETPEQPFSAPFSDVLLEDVVVSLQRPHGRTERVGGPEAERVKTFGGDLYEALFRDDLGLCLSHSLDATQERGHGLRIRLRLSDCPALMDVPWEFLYDRSRNRFVCLSHLTPVVRYLHLGRPPSPLRIGLPLRILVMISDPVDYDRLDVGRERANLRTAVAPLEQAGRLELEFLPSATPQALERALRGQDYHIFHFIGHGGFDETRHGVLVLEDDDGNGIQVSGRDIGAFLSGRPSLRLAVLDAVTGWSSGRQDPFADVAQALMWQGIPAVITMRFGMTHSAATILAEEFYSAMVTSLPVDAALAEARKAIYGQSNPIEWAAPVLYMRSPDGILFQFRPEGPREEAAAPGLVVDEDVQFTVYRPQVLYREQWASLLVYAHKTTSVVEPGRPPIDPVKEVEARARAHFGGAPPHPVREDSRRGLSRGAQLRIVPDLPGVHCNPEHAAIEWWEPVHELVFRLFAGPELAGTVVRGAVRVWCGAVILAEVSITIQVAADGPVAESPLVAESAQRYRKIFPSYSHRDRAIVANFAEAARALGDQYLQDVLALRAGEPWNARLLELIEDADVFQLFWSRNSMHSPHCRDEWEHALALRRDEPFIRPLYWEDPLPADPGQELPPAGLRDLHFVKVPAVPEPLGSEWAAASPRAEAPARPAPPPPGTMAGRAPGRGRRGRKRWLGLATGLAAAVAVFVAVGVVPRLGTWSGAPVSNAPPPATFSAAPSPSASSIVRLLPASHLLPGDCLTGSNLPLNKSGQWPAIVQAVPCDQEHTAEVYYSSNYWPADQAYPGERVKFRQATVRCNKAFHSYVGIPYSQSVFAKTVITPSRAGWDSGDRQLTCIAYKPTKKYPGGAPLHASIRGTAR